MRDRLEVFAVRASGGEDLSEVRAIYARAAKTSPEQPAFRLASLQRGKPVGLLNVKGALTYGGRMSDAVANVPEFGFVESLPTIVAEETKTGLNAMKRTLAEYERLTQEHGPLVPPATVAEHLGISKQGVADLVERNRLATVTIFGRRWIVGRSVLQYLEEGPRKGGRPPSKVKQQWNLGTALAKTAEGLLG